MKINIRIWLKLQDWTFQSRLNLKFELVTLHTCPGLVPSLHKRWKIFLRKEKAVKQIMSVVFFPVTWTQDIGWRPCLFCLQKFLFLFFIYLHTIFCRHLGYPFNDIVLIRFSPLSGGIPLSGSGIVGKNQSAERKSTLRNFQLAKWLNGFT